MPDDQNIRVVQYQEPNAGALVLRGQAAVNDAQELIIDSIAMRSIATDDMNANKRAVGKLDEGEKYLTKPLLEHVERIRGLFRRPKELHKEAAGICEAKILEFNREQEAARRAEEEHLAAIAKKEQARLAEEAAKVAAKAAQDAEDLRKKAAEAAAAGDAGKAAQLEARAEAKAEAGETRAAVLNDMAAAAPTAAVLPAAPKMAGAHETGRWGAVVTNKAELVRFVAANPMFLHLLEVDQKALNAQARSLREAFAIPGAKAECKISLTSRAT